MTDRVSDARQFSEACERNKEPIGDRLAAIVGERGVVLEIGSGTGQHAAYLSARFSGLMWQPSDLGDRFDSVRAWTAERDNVLEPIVFDLLQEYGAIAWPFKWAAAIVCINTIHIAPWEATERLFGHAARILEVGGPLYLYGPFRYRTRPLEPSNERFDEWLRAADPARGIRTFEEVDAIAARNGFELEGDVAMPANNRSIWWRRRA